MAETYRVVDLSNLYARFCPNIAFLVLTDDEDKAESVKRIRIEPKRFCDMKYREDEEVRLILKNSSTGKYEILKVPFQKGIYGMYDVLNKMNSNDDYFYSYYETWKNWGKIHRQFEENVTIYDNAMIIDGNKKLEKKLIMTNTTIVEGTDMILRQVGYSKLPVNLGDGLLNKCLRGEQVTVSDFFLLVDNEFSYGLVYVSLGDLQFEFRKEEVLITKLLAGQGSVQEEFSCRFSKERIGGIPSMFFARLLKAESKKQLLKCIDECFICEE